MTQVSHLLKTRGLVKVSKGQSPGHKNPPAEIRLRNSAFFLEAWLWDYDHFSTESVNDYDSGGGLLAGGLCLWQQ